MINGLPNRLRQLRLRYCFSQKDVANKLKVSTSIISAYETGERTPSTEIILAISYLYNVSTDYLLGKENKQPQISIDTSGLNDKQIKSIKTLIKSFQEK
jgi:transcriptional regulator with XRE-family HTH domain